MSCGAVTDLRITGNLRAIVLRPVIFARLAKPTAKSLCWLLHKPTERYPHPGNMAAVFKYIASLASELREKGVFNMLLSDGRWV